MKRIVTYIVFSSAIAVAMAQINVSGTVIDKDRKELLIGSSVIVRDSGGKIEKYATTKSDGSFAMSLPSIPGYRLEISMMSFTKETIPLDNVSFPHTVKKH